MQCNNLQNANNCQQVIRSFPLFFILSYRFRREGKDACIDCLIKHSTTNTYLGGGGHSAKAPRILNVGTEWLSSQFHILVSLTCNNKSRSNRLESWGAPGAGMDVAANSRTSISTRYETQTATSHCGDRAFSVHLKLYKLLYTNN
jgi:hypothetical protein